MFKPLHDYVLVKQNAREEQSAGGIVLAHTHQGLESGSVIAVGTGYINQDGSTRPLTVKAGDTVYLNGNPVELLYEGTTYLLFRERDLIGIEQ
jgi:chaperonin GroES